MDIWTTSLLLGHGQGFTIAAWHATVCSSCPANWVTLMVSLGNLPKKTFWSFLGCHICKIIIFLLKCGKNQVWLKQLWILVINIQRLLSHQGSRGIRTRPKTGVVMIHQLCWSHTVEHWPPRLALSFPLSCHARKISRCLIATWEFVR